MKVGDQIFVYGTLRRNERASLHSDFYSYGVNFLGNDRLNGKLYHLGSFPGVKDVFPIQNDGHDDELVFNSDFPIVVGEAFRIRDASIIAHLDAYEGYRADAPTTGLYNRCQVFSEAGRRVWVYVYNGMVIPEQRIPSGDWCKGKQLIETRGRSPLAGA